MVTLTQKNTVKVSREEGFKTIAQLITLELVVRRASKLDPDSDNILLLWWDRLELCCGGASPWGPNFNCKQHSLKKILSPQLNIRLFWHYDNVKKHLVLSYKGVALYTVLRNAACKPMYICGGYQQWTPINVRHNTFVRKRDITQFASLKWLIRVTVNTFTVRIHTITCTFVWRACSPKPWLTRRGQQMQERPCWSRQRSRQWSCWSLLFSCGSWWG